ncbi:LETM1 domain-containing protein 1 isoform X2 [Anabrus simplex]|uniref:LETM1 domain-containing protein 1 isoform X2 n=1 Tax=Anabrus simplex TaxID=316456 RepID=UPI0035A3628C
MTLREIIGDVKLCYSQKSSTQPKEATKVQNYVFQRYLRFVQTYEKLLESRFPTAMHVYRIFMVGIKEFYADMKSFFRIVKKVNASPEGFKSLTLQEIHLYYQMPKDMKKVAPVLILSALPFANYIILPLVYFFPRQLLCSHFWTLQQKTEFALHSQRRRLYNYRPVFRALQAQLDFLDDSPLKESWAHALSLLGSGVHPKPEEILLCKDLFCSHPYHLLHLYSSHVNALLRMHGMHVGWKRRSRLAERALIIQEMDFAIIREGGPSALSYEDLRQSCFIRGLNPVNMKTEDIVDWLSKWITISEAVDEDSWSLLLHCPVLLSYNQPTNWSLLHC